ncbi:MAG TPA: AI-2E family transporter YdiK [Burkholderiales bacterium]|nr:AI-2E family transporter YdiK [Burkholderiales bacterium]
MPEPRRDLMHIVLAVMFIGGLIAASLWILSPFLGALIWAVMIVIPTWPGMRRLQPVLWGRRWLAASAASVILLLLLIVPVLATVVTILGHVEDIRGWARYAREFRLPAPPGWVAGLPLVGERAVDVWRDVAAKGVESLGDTLAPYAGDLAQWFIARIGTLGAILVQLVLTVIAAAVLYIHGERAADAALRLGARLAGEQGEGAVRLSAQAIRGVALGVVVTALLQALVGGAGLAIAGVPFATVLTALMFLLAVAQIGAAIVLLVPVVWLYWSGSVGWGTFLLVVMVVTATIDNVVRPILIKKGADLPLLLVFVGVIGGLVAFGLVGIFVGPVVLAVSYTLLRAWLGMEPATGRR